jgi:hypothetical protein
MSAIVGRTLDVAVVLFVYNRLETTARVFARIAEARPRTLLIVGDGPHPDRPNDAERCEAVQRLVTRPEWDCDLRVSLAPVNWGFNRRISSGLDWAFRQFEELIILEDDCVPDPTFFPYCAELLHRYRLDDRIMMITGDNFQFGRTRGDSSYYFSHGVGTWGWASWRRAFQHFDPEMRTWPQHRDLDTLDRIWPVPAIANYWRERFDEAYQRRVDAWDYQWAFAMWQQGGLQIAPNTNLISYIGCLADTAHTTDLRAPYCNLPTSAVQLPMRHPPVVARDLTADCFEFYRTFVNEDDSDAERHSLAPAVSLPR